MAYVYNKVNWEDTPSTNTPRNATNLGNMDTGIKENNNMLNGTKPMGSIVVDDVKCKNLFVPTTKVGDTSIAINNGSVTLSGDEYSFTATGSLLYFGNVRGAGEAYTDDRGKLIDVEGLEKITVTITNPIFNRVYVTAYNSSKISLGWSNGTGNVYTYTLPANTKYVTIRWDYTDSVAGTTYKTKVQVEAGEQSTTYTTHKEFTNGNCASVNKTFTSSQTISGTTATAVTGMELSIRTTGKPLFVSGSFIARSTNSNSALIQLYIDGAEKINRMDTIISQNEMQYTFTRLLTDIPAGNHTIAIYIKGENASSNINIPTWYVGDLCAWEI